MTTDKSNYNNQPSGFDIGGGSELRYQSKAFLLSNTHMTCVPFSVKRTSNTSYLSDSKYETDAQIVTKGPFREINHHTDASKGIFRVTIKGLQNKDPLADREQGLVAAVNNSCV